MSTMSVYNAHRPSLIGLPMEPLKGDAVERMSIGTLDEPDEAAAARRRQRFRVAAKSSAQAPAARSSRRSQQSGGRSQGGAILLERSAQAGRQGGCRSGRGAQGPRRRDRRRRGAGGARGAVEKWSNPARRFGSGSSRSAVLKVAVLAAQGLFSLLALQLPLRLQHCQPLLRPRLQQVLQIASELNLRRPLHLEEAETMAIL